MHSAATTYVRHAMPRTEAGVDPTEWHLDDQARQAAGALADRLEITAGIGALVSSSEPKALDTAELIGARWGTPTLVDDRLREVARPWVGTGYRLVAHRYLRGDLPDGWEPHADAAARAAAAVREAKRSTDGPVVVVSHGLLLSVHLGDILAEGFDRETFWSCLSFPDAWSLEPVGTLHRPTVGAGSGR
jgi:broad specificity phosphatase PhoE